MHQTTVSKMEKELIPLTDDVLKLVDDVKVNRGERYVLLRRRLHKTLADGMKATGIHQHRLSEMERGLRDVSPAYVQWIETLIKAES